MDSEAVVEEHEEIARRRAEQALAIREALQRPEGNEDDD